MDLSKLNKKTIGVSRGLTYTYYTHPARDDKPTVLLFHGWPDTARLWAGLINNYLAPNGYGVIAPDCLGYGDTSKPTDPAAYSWSLMTRDAIEIIDAEGITDGVISVGHDWGCMLAQRLYNFYPDRVRGVILMNVAYLQPTGSFDLEETNKLTEEAIGYPIYAYWYFFMADDAPDLMAANLESVYAVAFGDPETWKENWTTRGGMRRFITEGRTQPTLGFATPEHKTEFMDRLSQGVGFRGSNCWYKAFADGTQNQADETVQEEAKTIRVPVLYWGGEQDYVCRPAFMDDVPASKLVPDCKIIKRRGGHWALLEQPKVMGQDLLGWLEEKF